MRTSVIVTKPRRGSLTRRSSICATMTLIWSATLWIRGPAMILSKLSGTPPPRASVGEGVRRGCRSGASLLAQLERLDDVADLDVVEALEHETALEAFADLGHIVLLAAEARS